MRRSPACRSCETVSSRARPRIVLQRPTGDAQRRDQQLRQDQTPQPVAVTPIQRRRASAATPQHGVLDAELDASGPPARSACGRSAPEPGRRPGDRVDSAPQPLERRGRRPDPEGDQPRASPVHRRRPQADERPSSYHEPSAKHEGLRRPRRRRCRRTVVPTADRSSGGSRPASDRRQPIGMPLTAPNHRPLPKERRRRRRPARNEEATDGGDRRHRPARH